ncbi:hypothetical protein ACD631_02550 [Alteromonas macleodii]|uniref:hypothetical protein n=1 Tax=Alteromonas macleodii TaxID=28108 RepID=UPI002076A901|nr:hypothetical protein [Alteromonas macleodii]USI29242.1 hypothetical protein NFG60_06000 [Alteromonas macleodii]|tara:strand:- start:200 stop:973 length:774 start_codon:yes stop_codon:yes gene_type:complete
MTSKKNYLFYAIVDWLFKKSPVTYFIGGAIGVAGMLASGGLSFDLASDSLKLTYSNELTIVSGLVVITCVMISYGAVRMQMKERHQKILNVQEKEKIELLAALERKMLDKISDKEKELEKLKADLELEKVKSANKHKNIGSASNRLLADIVCLEKVFAGICGSGRLLTKDLNGTRLDVYIANAIMNQHKYKYVFNSDPALKEAWNCMLEELDASQRAITLAFQDEALDVGVISSTAMSISKFMGKVSESGHLVVTET